MRMRSGWTLGTDLPKKGIVLICSLDAQSENVAFVKDLIRRRGHEPILLDLSMELAPPFPGDVTCEQVAARGGLSIENVRAFYGSDRGRAMGNQIAGGAAIVHDLLRQGRVHGVLGIGCRTATIVATGIMKTLPFGLPKLMASPATSDAAANEAYVGTRDITLHHTVLDIGKPNPLLKAQLTNAVGAVCGMVEMTRGTEYVYDKPVVAVSSARSGGIAVQATIAMLEEEGFTPVACDAFGKGARAMEEMIRDGAFSGVLDLCIGGVLENLVGGKRDPWTGRLMGAVTRAIPAVLAPGGLDMLGDGAHALGEPRSARTTAEQLIAAADAIAGRLNQAKAPFTFLIPLQGWSSLSREGRPLFDPVADSAFAKRLKEKIATRGAVVEVDLHLDSPAFARAAVDEFVRLFASTHGQRTVNASR
jgi:uncharacterized protein (UPF0261 family)